MCSWSFPRNDQHALSPAQGHKDETADRLKSAQRSKEEFLNWIGNDGNVWNIPEAIRKDAQRSQVYLFNQIEPFSRPLQGDMRRIKIADPLFALPQLEQRIRIGRSQDQDSARFQHAADLAQRPSRVGQVLDDMFDDHHPKGRVRIRQVLRAGRLQISSPRLGFRAGNRPMIQIYPERFKTVFELTDEVSQARADLKQAQAALSIATRQHSEEAIRPPILAELCKRNVLIGVRGKIVFVEGHNQTTPAPAPGASVDD